MKILSFFLKNLVEVFRKIWKKRFISILVLASISVIVVLFLFMTLNKKRQVVIKGSNQTPVNINRLQVIVPDGAFPSSKKFVIKEISKSSEIYNYAVENEDFVSDMYEVFPEDGKEELALLPLTLRYIVPAQYYLGDNFYNLSLGYLDKDSKIARNFYGSEIVKDGNNIYVEAKTFHTSIIGLIAKRPVNESFGLKKLIDKPENYKPYILIVPGIDENFSGSIPNTYSDSQPSGRNFWEVLFPDRSIWVYKYPLKDSRPNIYVEAARNFFKNFGRTDYVVYEAKRLSTELKRIPFKFDIIAHGIGGLIVRYAIESDPTIKNVRKVVLISTPNLGTNLANPVYLNTLYGKADNALAKIYDVDVDSITYIKNITTDYLEKVNVFWESIKPGSKTLEELNSFGIREDIGYLAICGTSTNFPINIENSELSKFYPEFVEKIGDGIVTLNSATLNGKFKFKSFNYSFHELYFQKDVLETIKNYLEDVKPPEKYTFKDDKFLEKLPNNKERTEFFSTPTVSKTPSETKTVPSEKLERIRSKGSNYIQVVSLKNSDRKMQRFYPNISELIRLPKNTKKLFYLSGSIFFLCDDQLLLYESTKKEIRKISDVPSSSFANIWKNYLIVYSNSQIKKYDKEGNLISKKNVFFTGANNLLDLFMTSNRYYVLIKDVHGIIFKVFDERSQMLFSEKIEGIEAHFKYSPKYNQLFVVSNDEIRCYEIPDNREMFIKTENSFRKYASISKERRLEFSDVERIGEWLIVLTKEYEIFANNLLNGKVLNLGFGDVGSNRLLFDGISKIHIFGEKTINFLNLRQQTIEREEKYVKFDEQTIVDAAFGNGKLYLIVESTGEKELIRVKLSIDQ